MNVKLGEQNCEKAPFTECVYIVGSAVKKYDGTKLYVSTGALDCDHIDFSRVEEVSYEDKPSRANLTAQCGDILFAKMQGTRKTIVLDEKTVNYIYSTGFAAVRPKEEILSVRCLYHLITSDNFLRQKDKNCTGATQKAITNNGLEKITVSVPDRKLQDCIAAVLDKIDSLTAKRRRQLEKLDELVKSRFVEMFGDPAKSTRYPHVKVKSFTRVISGSTPSRNEQAYWTNGNIRWVKTTELQNNEIFDTEERITEAALENTAVKLVPADTVLIAMYGQGKTRGMTAYLKAESTTNQACACILPSEQINPKYLWHFFMVSYDDLRNLAAGSNQPNLNGEMIKNYPVLMPPMALQNEYIEYVNHVKNIKPYVRRSLDALETLKKSLMQSWFG